LSYPTALGNLTFFQKSSPSKNVTIQVGDGWGELPVAMAGQIELIEEYFNTQAPI
jgi:hypothetical protein